MLVAGETFCRDLHGHEVAVLCRRVPVYIEYTCCAWLQRNAQAVCEQQTTFRLAELVLAWTMPRFWTLITDEASINSWRNVDRIERLTAMLKTTISESGRIPTGFRRMADRKTAAVGSQSRCCCGAKGCACPADCVRYASSLSP